MRRTSQPADNIPAIDTTHCAMKKYPACESLSAHFADKMGSIGPSNVITTPDRMKSRCANTTAVADDSTG